MYFKNSCSNNSPNKNEFFNNEYLSYKGLYINELNSYTYICVRK